MSTAYTGYFKQFWLSPSILHKRNQVFLSICLFVASISLWYVHSMMEKPFILGQGNMETIAIQFFFFDFLTKFAYGLTFYSFLSSLFFWWLFYFKAVKVDLQVYVCDFILMSLWVLFTFIILATIVFCDLSIASLKVVAYGLGYQEVDLWQSLSRVLAADLKLSLGNDCLSCKEVSSNGEPRFQKESSQLVFFPSDFSQISFVVDGESSAQPNPKLYPQLQKT